MTRAAEAEVAKWVDRWARIFRPDRVHWCDGSQREYEWLCGELVASGTFTRLNATIRPDSWWARSDPDDVARVEDRTFICSRREEDAGPTNHWRDPLEMRSELTGFFQGAMCGRTMFVVPFSMGPIGSSSARLGIQLTDSPYVVVSMRIMTRMGRQALDALGDGPFVRCLHSVGAALPAGGRDVAWPCDPEHRYVVHFPETREIWSYGSGYGGERVAGEEEPRLADRVGDGSGRRLVGRAHADHRRHPTRRREALRSRRRSPLLAGRPTWR